MPFDLWFAFVATSAVLLIIPGPTTLTVISYSVSHGRRATLPLVAAVALGDSTALLVSLLGLGALLATSAAWFTALKWAGGSYLPTLRDAKRVVTWLCAIQSIVTGTRASLRSAAY